MICAFNVQHLESLNDMVKQATSVVVRETVPDSILKRADQVVDIDLAVEDLIDRLRAGKIYAPDKVSWALENFSTGKARGVAGDCASGSRGERRPDSLIEGGNR